MAQRAFPILLFIVGSIACSCASSCAPSGPASDDGATAVDAVAHDTGPADAGAPDAGGAADSGTDAGHYEIVHGWIILDGDPSTVTATIEAAAAYGVNQIQLSHDLIMQIDDVLGDDAGAQAKVSLLNDAIALAHAKGMKTYVWAHELSGTGMDVCYEPGGDVWTQRADAYRRGIAKIPAVDGIVLQFGSAQMPPWVTVCSCEWCQRKYPGESIFNQPPNAEKIRLITKNVGAVVIGELHKEIIARVFVHNPAENAWHADGYSAVDGLPFITMHKSETQDWEPYNPPDPTMGAITGGHPPIMETDPAGEYYGISVLPFCAPGYFRHRLARMREAGGIGVASRVSRGSASALGTPNEINLYAMKRLLDDPAAPLGEIWDGFIESFYRVAAGDPARPVLRSILEDTFAIRLKSHYVLGIWALNKDSDLPDGIGLDQFNDRGKMPKWDPDWQAIWDGLDKPDKAVVWRIWQEGTEAVSLAAADLVSLASITGSLDEAKHTDLDRRIRHQAHAARAWRAVKLFIWSKRALDGHAGDPDLPGYLAWAHEDLSAIASAMDADGLSSVAIASPGQIRAFIANTAALIPAGATPATPAVPVISPLTTLSATADAAELGFAIDRDARVAVDYGLEVPDYGTTLDVGDVKAGAVTTFMLANLQPGKRHVVRLRATVGGTEYTGGDWWVFTESK